MKNFRKDISFYERFLFLIAMLENIYIDRTLLSNSDRLIQTTASQVSKNGLFLLLFSTCFISLMGGELIYQKESKNDALPLLRKYGCPWFLILYTLYLIPGVLFLAGCMAPVFYQCKVGRNGPVSAEIDTCHMLWHKASQTISRGVSIRPRTKGRVHAGSLRRSPEYAVCRRIDCSVDGAVLNNDFHIIAHRTSAYCNRAFAMGPLTIRYIWNILQKA